MNRLFDISIMSSLLLLFGCSYGQSQYAAADCSTVSSTSLQNYDSVSKSVLDEETRHPIGNSGGNIVWGTRYYMESLLDAYEATNNPKYIQAFLDTGNWVMNLAGTLTVLDVADSSSPGHPATSPVITVMGWPTKLQSFGAPVPILTANGQIALYAQGLDPEDPHGPNYFQVIQQQDGSLELAWIRDNTVLQGHTIQNSSDLSALASEPLDFGHSIGRIKPTGLGLPAPGKYEIDFPMQTIWHEQTAGILLPFARFLLLASQHPELADTATLTQWKSKVLAIAEDEEDEFISDGHGGLRFVNPIWLPNALAGTDAALDYIAVETTLRLFLYQLTRDPHQLAIAKGLILHQTDSHLQINSRGWLLLKYWPDALSWSNQIDAPSGSIWSSFQFDSSAAAPVTDAGFFVYLLHIANSFNLAPDLGITEDLMAENRAALLQYIIIPPGREPHQSSPLLRSSYPALHSRASDSITPAQDPWAGSGFLTPELADRFFINANWRWMMSYGRDQQGWPIGYFLRAWARSEAAEIGVCKVQSH